MDFFAGIKTYIYILSSCILYPVLLLLAGLSVWIFYECGRFFAFRLERRRDPDPVSRPVRQYLEELENLLRQTTFEEDIQNLLRKRIQERLASLDKYLIAARIVTLVLLPRMTHAMSEPMNAFPRPIHVDDRPYFQPNCPAYPTNTTDEK